MDEVFDQMIRDHMKEALEQALKTRALGPLLTPQETGRQRFQRQLGDLLISWGTRLQQGAAPTS